jgi:hypothetical protein
MSKRKSGGQVARSPSPREIVCILVVDIVLDKFEVEHLALTSYGAVPYTDGRFSSNLPARADCRTG